MSCFVKKLVLNYNKWNLILDNIFDGLKDLNIYYIDLFFNNLYLFNGLRIFWNILNFKYLILDGNFILDSDIDFYNMEYIFKLSL